MHLALSVYFAFYKMLGIQNASSHVWCAGIVSNGAVNQCCLINILLSGKKTRKISFSLIQTMLCYQPSGIVLDCFV